MIPRRRRCSVPKAAVLWALYSWTDTPWSTGDIVDLTEMPYGTVYAILHNLHNDGMVARIYLANNDAVGYSHIYFELTTTGEKFAKRILKSMPDPVPMAKAMMITDDDY